MSAVGENLISVSNTVFALSTPVGGAIAVIRATGPLCRRVLESVFSGRISERLLSFGRISDGGKEHSHTFVEHFPAPHSYTGEDMFELDLHGSYAVVTAVSRLLLAKGLEPAPAGEFTKRAFLNGRMDLVQADAVMDLINSETERSARAAMDQLRGGLSARIRAIEEQLLDFGSELGAALDYPDEMEDEVLSSVPGVLLPALSELGSLIENGKTNKIVRDGAKLVIIGRPNAGKSSLLNALLNEDRAIVTEYAGTTRDILEEKLSLCGLPVRLVDTAGLRESADPVEAIGIVRAEKQAETAELVLLVIDGSEPLSCGDRELVKKTSGMPVIFVINKQDLAPETALAAEKELTALRADAETAVISCKTRSGIDELARKAAALLGAGEGGAIVTNERHIALMELAKAELEKALDESSTDLVSELVASALSALAGITGREFSEELLDRIFSRFCVGK